MILWFVIENILLNPATLLVTLFLKLQTYITFTFKLIPISDIITPLSLIFLFAIYYLHIFFMSLLGMVIIMLYHEKLTVCIINTIYCSLF